MTNGISSQNKSASDPAAGTVHAVLASTIGRLESNPAQTRNLWRRQASAYSAAFSLLRNGMIENRGFDSHSLRHMILKYKVNLCFSMVDSRVASGRDGGFGSQRDPF
jgi:hypothetical protein